MTESTKNQPENNRASTSIPAAPAQGSLIPEPEMGLRVTQAEFARIMGVSRQSVSKWVAAGKVRPDLDGRFCPKRAARTVLASTDPKKIRARILKDAAEDAASLRAEVDQLRETVDDSEANIRRLREVIARLERDQAEADRQMEITPEMLAIRWDDFAEMRHDERARAIAGVLDDALLSASLQVESEATARALGIEPDGPGAKTLEHSHTDQPEFHPRPAASAAPTDTGGDDRPAF